MRSGDGDYEGVISQTHMQHVLSLEERAEVSNRMKLPDIAAPDLRDSPLQKEFLATIEEFERKLIIVTVLSLVIVAIGILGTFLSKSKSLQYLSYMALALNLNWLLGFLASNKVKKELLRVKYSYLNG